MRCLALAGLAACSYSPHGVDSDAAEADAAVVVDVAADTTVVPVCPNDPHLRLCFSFDQNPLPATLPDEGAAVVDAELTNVMRIDHDDGGAALLDATSTIWMPMTDVSGIQTLEISVRIDADAANGGRYGIVDSDVIPPNISLFMFRTDPMHQLRCGIGAGLISFTADLAIGTWYQLTCVCDADALTMYVDGTSLGTTPGTGCSSGGAFVGNGFTIGQNNNGGPTGANDWLVGAVDRVRLWDIPVPP